MDAKQTALLRDVIATIVASGYAELPREKHVYRIRAAQINELAKDSRIESTAYSHDMIEYVMVMYNVKRNVAYGMLCSARKKRKGAHGTQ